jgi:hypothetical protein
MPNHAFTRLRDFISTAMQMSHVYQPVMLRTLIDKGGKAAVSEVAQALLAEDQAQLDYYREITKRMPGAVLRRRGVIDYQNGAYSIPGGRAPRNHRSVPREGRRFSRKAIGPMVASAQIGGLRLGHPALRGLEARHVSMRAVRRER